MGPQVGFNGGQALMTILALTVAGRPLRQLMKSKRKDSKSTLRTDCPSGEENSVLRDSESISRTDDPTTLRKEGASGKQNLASRRDPDSTTRRNGPTTLRTENAFGEEKVALTRNSESNLRRDIASRDENEALRRDLESTSRSNDPTTSRTSYASREEEVLKRNLESTSKMDDQTTLRMDDTSIGESDAFGRDWESTLRTEDASVKENEAFHTSTIEYEVFLSFQGRDMHDNFADCLFHRLRLAGIHIFRDNAELQVGKDIRGDLMKALNKSRIYIPIFSHSYATSSRCLREVAHMEKCTSKSDGKKEILPIFYNVDPDDVKLKTELYKKAIAEHEMMSNYAELKRWEYALVKVAHLKGWDLKGKGQGELIELFVEEVICKLKARNADMPENLVEDHSQIKAIMEKLDVNSDGVRFLGIHGVGGIGKTVLVKTVFNKLYSLFDGASFLDDVRESSEQGLINLQKKLLSGFVGSMITDQIEDIGAGMNWIKKVCSTKKVLIVLDDLDKKEQLERLAGNSDWFGSGSRVIFTTRNMEALMTRVESSSKELKPILAYEARGMEFGQALKLFCKHTFRRDSPMKGYDHIAEKIVRKVGMLPLAIEVIGSSLYCQGLALEQYFDKRKLWENTLKQLDEGPFKDVRDLLMISYKRLENKQKEIFLDIACIFTNEDLTYPVIMWDDCNYHAHRAISVLLLRSLIKIRDNNKFWMHDQVRDLGRHIILEVYPCKFSRVWTCEDAVKLLGMKEINQDVEALSLTFNGFFAPEQLLALPNLRFLKVEGSDNSGDFKYCLLKLRWLSWKMTHNELHVEKFHFTSLVVLDLSRSAIEDDWDGWNQIQMTNKLKVLDLTECTKLTRTPDFSNFMSLEILILACCPKLVTIDRSIGKLELLKTLNIKGCSSLGELPKEVGSLHSLTQIIMPRNFQSLKLPEEFGNLISLSSFILDEHPRISELPMSIGGLINLTHFSLRGCLAMKFLPRSIGELQMMVELDISKSGIVELPDSVGYLKKLKVLRVSYTVITKFPHTIGHMEMLEELHAKKCWDLTDENLEEIGKLYHLRILDLSYTCVRRLPEVISCLSHLQELKVGSIKLRQVTGLPSSLTSLEIQAIDFSFIPDLSGLFNLDHLELYRTSTFLRKEPCLTWRNDLAKMEEARLKEQPIHQLPSHLSTLKLKGINLLPHFSNLKMLSVLLVSEFPMRSIPICQGLIHLRELKINRCEFLEEIPDLALLKSLQRLHLNGLNRLVEILSLSELESLQYIRLSRCPSIEALPNLSKFHNLQHLELENCPKLRAIEGVEGVESWKLDGHGRIVLERLLDVSKKTWLCHKLPMYDVFLSFRGPDTRYSIVNFLQDMLDRSQISFFRYDDEMNSGEGIGQDIEQALDNAHVYVPIFSKNFASSRFPLSEVEQMVDHTEDSKGKRRIIPIFYDVKIDDVKLESSLYRKALDEHSNWLGDDKVEAWKVALRKVAHMKGFDLVTNSPEEIVQEIIAEVMRVRQLIEDDS